MKKLIKHLQEVEVLKTPRIIEAFEKVDRKDFVLDEYKDMTYIDEALPIGEGQTISQPYTVAFMLELLRPEKDDKILDIGAGSGWQSALLAQMGCKVYSMEIIPELCEFGKNNTGKYDIEWFCQSAEKGLADQAPFDRIIAAATLDGDVPKEWFNQLKTGGRLVVPIKNSIWLFIKKDGKIEKYEHPGFVFVPFR